MSPDGASSTAPASRRDWTVAALVFVTTFAVFLASPVHPLGDSHYSLLVSERLLTRGSFALDEYFKLPLDPRLYPGLTDSRGPYPYQIETVGGHQHYYFPVGGPVLSVPFVAGMRAVGVSTITRDDIYNRRGEVGMQAVLASFLMGALAVLFYATARLLLPVGWSLIGALTGVLGTQAITSNGGSPSSASGRRWPPTSSRPAAVSSSTCRSSSSCSGSWFATPGRSGIAACSRSPAPLSSRTS